MSQGPLLCEAVSSIKFHTAESNLVDYEIDVKDLKVLSDIFEAYNRMPACERMVIQNLSKGQGIIK